MSKHTPGPWVWTPDAETIHGYSPEGEALVVVYELGTHEPDALLMAAAPTMLAALISIRDAKPYGIAHIDIDAVIAEATGDPK